MTARKSVLGSGLVVVIVACSAAAPVDDAIAPQALSTTQPMIAVHLLEPGGFDAIAARVQRAIASAWLPGTIEPNPREWPFPVGLDSPASSPAFDGQGDPRGQTGVTYGTHGRERVPIDAEGRVIAVDESDHATLDARLAALLSNP